MRKIVVAIIVVLFFLLVLAAVLFKLLKPAEHSTPYTAVSFPTTTKAGGSTDQNPEQFTKSFYQWYLLNFSRDPLFPHPENRNELLSPWLTGSYLAQWDNIHYEVEVNPVLQSAEDPATWGPGLSVRTIEQSIRTRTVYVTIGTGTSVHALNVNLVQDKEGSWKIDAVVGVN